MIPARPQIVTDVQTSVTTANGGRYNMPDWLWPQSLARTIQSAMPVRSPRRRPAAGGVSRRRMPSLARLHLVLAEIVRPESLEPLLHLLFVLLVAGVRRDRLSLIEHGLGDEDRGVGAEGEGDGVAGAGV